MTEQQRNDLERQLARLERELEDHSLTQAEEAEVLEEYNAVWDQLQEG